MQAALIVKPKGDVKSKVESAIQILRKYNIEPLIEKETVERLILSEQSYSINYIRENADVIIILGGDGTLLYSTRVYKGRDIPFLGFNLGTVGFIMELNFDDFEKHIVNFLNNKSFIKKRMKIQGTLIEDDVEIFKEEALNEIAINKGAPSRMVDLSVYIDNNLVTRYRSDGAILSTPTGSTGYTISAGGPIVHPDLNSIILSPICPHSLNIRPIVVPKSSVLDVVLETKNAECYVTYDGQIVRPFNAGNRIRINQAEKSLSIVTEENRNYYSILRDKLGWGGSPC